MLRQLVRGNVIEIGNEYNIEHLKSIMDEGCRICIHNPSLIRTLEERGLIRTELIINRPITLVPGDTLLSIVPSESIEGRKNDETILPDHITFKVGEYLIKNN